MLMDDINSNRHHVQSIFTPLSNAQDKNEILFILKQLVREELLSLEQLKQLSELEQMDLPTIARVINDTKYKSLHITNCRLLSMICYVIYLTSDGISYIALLKYVTSNNIAV